MKKMRKDKVVVYWVSYLEGQQRVLMFTQDERVAYHTRGWIDAEKSNLEVFVSLQSVGLSLVRDFVLKKFLNASKSICLNTNKIKFIIIIYQILVIIKRYKL